ALKLLDRGLGARGDAADPAADLLCEPQVAVAADGDVGRIAARSDAIGELLDLVRGGVHPPDLGVAVLDEPDVAVGSRGDPLRVRRVGELRQLADRDGPGGRGEEHRADERQQEGEALHTAKLSSEPPVGHRAFPYRSGNARRDLLQVHAMHHDAGTPVLSSALGAFVPAFYYAWRFI